MVAIRDAVRIGGEGGEVDGVRRALGCAWQDGVSAAAAAEDVDEVVEALDRRGDHGRWLLEKPWDDSEMLKGFELQLPMPVESEDLDRIKLRAVDFWDAEDWMSVCQEMTECSWIW